MPQMPAPRRAPKGGWHEHNQICYESNCQVYYSGCQPQNVKLFLRGPLVRIAAWTAEGFLRQRFIAAYSIESASAGNPRWTTPQACRAETPLSCRWRSQ
jgi:hypothetical protein